MSLIKLRKYALDKFPQTANWLLFLLGKKSLIFTDYKLNPSSRYGLNNPHYQLNTLLAKNEKHYEEKLLETLSYREKFSSISKLETDPKEPCWINGFFPGLDAVMLYSYIADLKPKRYIEVGSGNSTRFARKSILDNALSTKITSIDPYPRVGIDEICDEVIRLPLEKVELSIFDALEAGDVLFIDNSHYSFANTDVTVFFLDILPSLKPGVIIQVHDIFLPFDYTKEFAERGYQEQYLLATYLLANEENIEILMPNFFVSHHVNLKDITSPIWERDDLSDVERHGCSFWFTKT